MRPFEHVLGSIAVGIAAASVGTAAAQQPQGQEGQDERGIPATQHQQEALRDIGGDVFDRLDANRDGSISRTEAQSESALTEKWDEYDRDRNQTLDRDELSAYHAGESESAERDVDVAAGETVEGLPASPHQQEAIRGELVELLDANGDGTLSRDEAQNESDLISKWDDLDRNSDGVLDSSELGHVEE
ncbi:MAG TPA: EF-hand domain-containing protein [Gammaproteobacteria bacterium]